MDWSKAKTILIIMFLFLNIFLIYSVYDRESKTTIISQVDIDNIKTILQQNNIDLKSNIPNKIKPKAFLKIEDMGYNEENLLKSFFGTSQGVNKTNITDKDFFYKKENKSLEIYNNKRIVYINESPTDNIEGFNKNKVIKFVESYLKNNNIYYPFAVLDSFIQTQEGYEIRYKEEFRKDTIFISYMNINITNKGIAKIEMVWCKPIIFLDVPKDIKLPTEILLIFAKEFGNKEKIDINNISLGYYLPIDDLKNASVSAVPAWKVEINGGKTYYYNAYEGYLENKN